MREEIGLLISVAGPRGEVETGSGLRIPCHVRRNAPQVITGDQVTYELPPAANTGVITGHLPRQSLLSRPDGSSGRLKLMAANINCLVIVTSPAPVFSEERIDRYLIAAGALGIPPLILINKTDLLTPTEATALSLRLAPYQAISYPVCLSDTRTPLGLHALQATLRGKTAVLTGLSGVGKSSIIQSLTGDFTIRTDSVSASGAGKHTTTVSRLYHLPDGGQLIDSPGIRDFGLWRMPPDQAANGYPEFAPFLGKCRFRDCLHVAEPDCAIIEAATASRIDSGRLHRYQQTVLELRK